MEENKKLVPLSSTMDAKTAAAFSFNLCQFYQMYQEIFNYNIYLAQLKNNSSTNDEKCIETNSTSYHDPQVINQCIHHFRTIYRRAFRGIAYLTPEDLQKTQTRAMTEAVESLKNSASSTDSIKISNEALFKLKEQLAMEELWIATVNQQRRQAILQEIKMEAIEYFKVKLPVEFPLLTGNGEKLRLHSYEEDELSERVDKLKNDCTADFRNQISIKEEEKGMSEIVEDLLQHLNNNFIAGLVEENKNRKQAVITQMKSLVRASISNYKVAIKTATNDQFLLDMEAIMQVHNNLHQEFLSNCDQFPDSKYKRDQIQNYDDRVKRMCKEMVQAGNEAAQQELSDCIEESKTEIGKLVEMKLKDILVKRRIPTVGGHVEEVIRAVEESLGKSIGNLKSRNEENLQGILSQMKTEDERFREEMMRMLQVSCDTYESQLKQYMNHENTYWHAQSESFHIRQFHQEVSNKMSNTLEQIRGNNGYYAESVKESKMRFVAFADDHFRKETGLDPTITIYDKINSTTNRWSSRSDVIVRKVDLSEEACDMPSRPLIFQLSIGYIRMGMVINGKLTVLETEPGKTSTRTQVGLHGNGNFIFGEQLKDELKVWKRKQNEMKDSEAAPLQEIWDLHSIRLCQFKAWTDTVKYKNNEVTITYELLLAFLLRKLKKSIEAQMGVTCTATVIAVPIWFTSSERVRIKDAAEMAGFLEVHLINHVAAAAYSTVGAANKQDLDNVLVFSQDGTDSVDLTLYEVDKSVDSREQLKLMHTENVMVNSEKEDYEDFLAKVRKTCSQMLFSFGRVKYGAKLAVTVNWEPNAETSMQTQVLKRVASEMIGKRVEFTDGNEVVVKGAAMLAENLKEIGVRVRDKLYYDVLRHLEQDIKGSEQKCVFSSGELLPLNGEDKKIVTLLPKCMHKEAYFTQMFVDNEIGYVEVPSMLRYDKLEITLSINHEGIINFDGIRKLYIFSNNPSVDNDLSCTWVSPRLTNEEREEQRNLLEEAMKL